MQQLSLLLLLPLLRPWSFASYITVLVLNSPDVRQLKVTPGRGGKGYILITNNWRIFSFFLNRSSSEIKEPSHTFNGRCCPSILAPCCVHADTFSYFLHFKGGRGMQMIAIITMIQVTLSWL